MNAVRRSFTLIELLIVIGLLGAFVTLILPSFSVTRTEAMDPIVQTEMQDIRLAFQRFCHDVMPTDAELQDFRRYGLAPLMQREISGAYSFTAWNEDRQRGWRGPYLSQEGTRDIGTAADANGQDASGSLTIPVILDPYSESDSDGHFYRVLCRKNGGADWVSDDLALVFVGTENDASLLDTTPVDTAQSDWADKYTVGITNEIVRKLLIGRE